MNASNIDFAAIRRGLAMLPRAGSVDPGASIRAADVVIVGEHRAALDPERALVVGNRGMGKSFWTHALANPEARSAVAEELRLPELEKTDVLIGFNASERVVPVAPTPSDLKKALHKHHDPEAVWRAVLLRAASDDPSLPSSFGDLVAWGLADLDRAARLLTAADERIYASGRRLLVVFDALDRLAADWTTTRELTGALLRRALGARSYRALRMKLFMRTDQFEDPSLFAFPDGSKIKNTRVDLSWGRADLYTLLFERLRRSPEASESFQLLASGIGGVFAPLAGATLWDKKAIVDVLAGEFMGATKKRGLVFTWLPLHLADARRETSPRTFLTAWREAAAHGEPPAGRAVDHLGLLEGVRKASEDRLQELREDYFWIDAALGPLRGQMVPMEKAALEALWRTDGTARRILAQAKHDAKLPPVQLEADGDPEAALLTALTSIGVMESRSTGKIDVPDIFRVEAGIKRKGGVAPPRRARN